MCCIFESWDIKIHTWWSRRYSAPSTMLAENRGRFGDYFEGLWVRTSKTFFKLLVRVVIFDKWETRLSHRCHLFIYLFSNSTLFIHPRVPNTIHFHLYISMFLHDLSILPSYIVESMPHWVDFLGGGRRDELFSGKRDKIHHYRLICEWCVTDLIYFNK